MSHRRAFVRNAALLGLATLLPRLSPAHADEKPGADEEVSAAEDLMREHGLLNRILLVYEEGMRRLRNKDEVPPEVFQKPATLVRKFVEDYHEKLEENFLFPEFEKQQKLVDLVKVLRKQHAAGRDLTEIVLRETAPERFRKEDNRQQLVRACEAF